MNIIEIIETTVENMRDSATITNIVDNANGTYTVTAPPKNLSNTDYVTIASTTGFNAQYKISSVSGTGFNITKATGTAIPGSFGTYTANGPYFMKGRWSEITRELIDKGESQTYKGQRFPLIVLLIPIEFEEDKKKNTTIKDVSGLTIYYFIETDGTKNTDWRYTNLYSTLETLSESFNTEFKKAVIGEMIGSSEWNPHMDGRAYVFTSPVDAWVDTYSNLKLQNIC